MKLYLISMAAASLLPSESETILVQHMPSILLAETIEEASEQAKKDAFERWKTEDGWYSHQATILPTPRDLFELMADKLTLDALDFSGAGDEAKTFNFDDLDGEILM